MKLLRFLFVILILLVFPLMVSAQIGGPNLSRSEVNFKNGSLFQTSEKDSLSVWREQVLLHTDADAYQQEQNLFFKAYVLTGPNQLRVSASDVLRVELLDIEGNLVTDQYHKIENGGANGTVEIPKKLDDGTYFLRAYTRWMLNYGEENLPLRELTIANSEGQAIMGEKNITVVPEGGNFVVGLENKGIVSVQNSLSIQGKIIDGNGNPVSAVTNYDNGLATFYFTPKTGESYYFKSTSGRQVPLNEIQDEGVLLQANTIDGETIKVRVQATSAFTGDTYQLIGTKNDRTYFESTIEFDETKKVFELEIPNKGLPHGILNLEVTDSYNQVWAKRPVYVESGDLIIKVDKAPIPEDGNKQSQRYKLKVTDADGNPVATELSLSVREGTGMNPAIIDMARNSNFLTDLKVLVGRDLNGELAKGNVETPNNIKYSFQNGLEFYGQAYDFNNTLLTNKDIQVFINNESDVEVKEVATNEEGLFALIGLQLDGEVILTFRRDGKNTMEKLVKVIPFEYELPKFKVGGDVTVDSPKLQKSKQFIPQKRLADFDFKNKPANLIPLEEVTLVGKRELSEVTKSVYNITPTRVIRQDDERPKTIPQLFLGVPGVYVNNLGDIERVSISLPKRYGQGPVLWVLDGIPLVQANSGSLGVAVSPLAEIMSLVNFLDVERIELLAGADAGIYGSRAAGGVILIYTKSGAYSSEYIARKDAQTTFEGYELPLAFDDYMEGISKRRKLKENNKTLFWSPALQTDENGEVTFEFVLPAEESELLLDVKAITEEGKRGSYKTVLE